MTHKETYNDANEVVVGRVPQMRRLGRDKVPDGAIRKSDDVNLGVSIIAFVLAAVIVGSPVCAADHPGHRAWHWTAESTSNYYETKEQCQEALATAQTCTQSPYYESPDLPDNAPMWMRLMPRFVYDASHSGKDYQFIETYDASDKEQTSFDDVDGPFATYARCKAERDRDNKASGTDKYSCILKRNDW